jgi:predicted ester cyclase
MRMSTEDNKAVVRRFYEEVMNQKKRAVLDEVFDLNVVDHFAPPGTPGGLEGAKQTLGMFLSAFPDLIAEGDKVVARATLSGTQQGTFMGIPATGKRVTITGIDINRFVGGKSVEHWVEMDTLGMMQQLGVIPPLGPTS